ncbi:MAG TPA: hypothetical protein V6C69_07280 [Trichormus sp.]|jgi:hypothetical protein
MFRSLSRSVFLSALAVVGAMSLCPVQAEETNSVVATALPGLPINSDPAFQKAVDFIRENKVTHEKKLRRDDIKPVVQQKVVRAHDVDHMMIMGVDGSASLPM